MSKPHNTELYFEDDEFDEFIGKLKQRMDIQYIGEVVKRFIGFGMSMEQISKRMDVSVQDLETLLNS